MQSLASLIEMFDVEAAPHLDRQADIPVNSGLQRQGDVFIIPQDMTGSLTPATNQVPREGFPVVKGIAGGNTHLLLGSGQTLYTEFAAGQAGAQDLGVLTVPENSTGYLAHPEHGYLAIAPGTYLMRAQREQADEIRRVAD